LKSLNMRKRIVLITFPIMLILGIYFLGPEPDKPKWEKTMPIVPQDPVALEKYIADRERLHKVKPDNEARIVWADSTKRKTPYSVIYLHGFSASQKEGEPVHRKFASRFGCNLYLSRLADHGIDTTDQLLYFTVDRLWESSKEALAIGKAIGDKVIVLSCSTGGTVALVLAGMYPDDVFALVNMSPNIAINDANAWVLNDPWGLQIARMVFGSKYQDVKYPSSRRPFWNIKYRLESVTQLEELLEDKMNKETFAAVKQPSLTLYYFKNDQEQDKTVKVSAMLEMNKELGTPDSLKEAIAIPNAGAHVIGSYLVSRDLQAVQREAERFAMEKLHMKKVN
jgi:pimeloyl-ACP methyl ester carboxylesterase